MRSLEYREDRSEVGAAVALALILAVFELIPPSGYSRIAVRTSGTELEGVDAPVEYLVPDIEPPEEIEVDVAGILETEVDIAEIVLSLSSDTTGLEHVVTVNTDFITPDNPAGPEVIPAPGTFIPHSVPPRCTFRPDPGYPEMARMAGVEGRVTLQVFVTAEGVPAEVVLMQSSGLDSMDEAAMASARLTRWAPAERDDGVAVGVWTALIYEFELE